MKFSTLKKGLQKRNDPNIGKPFVLGAIRSDDKRFWGYTSYVKADGYRTECWLDPEKWEAHRLNTISRHWSKRGIDCTKDTRKKLFEEQRGRCAICNRHQFEFSKKLAVDHSHETEKVRGLLCSNCNHAIGQLKDDPELCFRAAEYLIKHGKELFTRFEYAKV
jgi:hypothetical protein